MLTDQIKQEFEAKLKRLPFGYESMQVFGTIRLNVHVVCMSRETANKWALALGQIGTVKIVKHAWEAKENKGTCLRPTMRKGYLIGMVI